VLKYRVVGGLQVNGQNTQVFWKAIWADRKSPIEASQVTVKLPDVLAGKVSSFQSFGIPTRVRQIDGQTFVFTAKQALPPQQELEVQITFPTGSIKLSPPSGQNSSGSGVIIDDSSAPGGFLGFILGALALILFTSPIWMFFVLLFINIPSSGGGGDSDGGGGGGDSGSYGGGGDSGGGGGGDGGGGGGGD
jgi:hypothetical protein